MVKPFISVLFLLVCSLSSLAASDGFPDSLFGGYQDYLGNTPDQVIQTLGAPDNMMVYQGQEDAFGSVVFEYDDSPTLFWIDNRVWQLRLDRDFLLANIPALSEITRDSLLRDGSSPYLQEEDLLVFNLEDAAFPTGCAFYFSQEGILEDLYIFRRDY